MILARLGAKRSHPVKLARRVELVQHPAVRRILGASLPTDFDLLQYQPQIFDQGQSGSCTANSSSSSIATAFTAAGHPLGFVPSPRENYAATRSLERALATPAGQPLPALTDSGAELADVFSAWAQFGASPIQAPTPDGRYCDIWTAADTTAQPPNVDNEPQIVQLEQGAGHIITGPYGVDPTSSSASDTLAAAIVAGIPVEMAFFADTVFMQLGPNDVAVAPNASDPNGGGHATYLSGFRTVNSVRQFRLTNSWGTGWCDGGRCWVGPAWLAAAWESWPVAVVVGVS